MYRLYSKECDKNGKQKASSSTYRHMFKNEFNLSFHKPKKDRCDLCFKFNPSPEDEKKMLDHQAQKELSRDAKENYKLLSTERDTISCTCFDLQKVLECPLGEASSYYSRKLAVYNLISQLFMYTVTSLLGVSLHVLRALLYCI